MSWNIQGLIEGLQKLFLLEQGFIYTHKIEEDDGITDEEY